MTKEYALHAQMLDAVGEAVIATDLQGKIQFWNRAAEELYQWSSDEVLGKDILEITPSDIARRQAEEIMQVLSQGVTWVGEFEVQRKDGTCFLAYVSNSPIHNEEGQLIGIIGVSRDISESKQIENDLRKSQFFLTNAQRMAQVGSWIWDVRTGSVEWNEQVYHIFGLDPGEFEPQIDSVMSRFHPEDRDYHQMLIQQAIEKRAATTFEARILQPDSSLRNLVSTAEPEFDDSGELIRMTGTVQDITERVQAQRIASAQRDLALTLSMAHGLEQGLALFLETALELSNMDSGGVYILDETTGALDLAVHQGLPLELIRSASHYEADSDNTRLVMKGKPVRARYPELGLPSDELREKEQLRAFAMIPLIYRGQVMGCLNIASHTLDEVPQFACEAIEAIASQLGDTITRLMAERDMSESRERFRIAGEAAYDLIYEWEVASDKLEWFGDIDGLLGYPMGQISEDIQAWLDLIHPEDKHKLEQAVEHHRASTQPIQYEYRVKHHDGTFRYWNDHGLPLLDEKGNPTKWIGVCTDITERKNAEKALHESNLLLNKSQEIAHIGSWYLDLQKNELTWSEEVYRIFGLDPVTFGATYEAFLEAVHPDDRQMVDQAYTKSLEENRPYEITHRVLRPDGTIRIVHEKSEEIKDETGKTIASYGVVHDITEQKLAEKALRESEERFRMLLEQSPLGIAIYTPDGRPTYGNPAQANLWNVTPEQLQQVQHSYNVLQDQQLVDLGIMPAIQRAFAGEIVKPSPVSYQPEVSDSIKDLPLRWLQPHFYPVKDEAGTIIEVVAIFEDITERKQADQALHREKVFTDSALDVQLDTFFLFDPVSDKALRWNKTFKEVSGYSDEEIANLPAPMSYYSPEDLQRATPFVEQVMREGSGTIELELICKDGKVIPTEYRVATINDENGDPKYFISIGRDISERVEAEQALRESEERYRVLVNTSPYGIQLSDLEGKIIFSNPAHHKIQGYEADELVGKYIWELVADEKDQLRTQAYYQELVSEQPRPTPFFSTDRTKDGRLIITQNNWDYIYNSAGELEAIVSIISDITDQKQAEESLQMAADIVRTIPAGLFIYQYSAPDKLYLLDANPEAEALTGISLDQWKDVEFNQIWTQSEELGIRERFLSPLTTGEPFTDDEFIYHDERLSGIYRVRTFALPRDRLGIAFEDITDRKIAEEALKETLEEMRTVEEQLRQSNEGLTAARASLETEKNRYAALFEFAPGGYIVSDPQGVIQEANQIASRLLRFSNEYLIGKPLPNYVSMDDRKLLRQQLNQMASGVDLSTLQLTIAPPESNPFPADVKIAAVRDSENELTGLRWLLEDISERLQAEEALRRSEERFELAVRGSNDGIWDWDIISQDEYWCSDRVYEMLGYQPEEIEATVSNWHKMMHPDDLPKLLKVLEDHQRSGTPYEVEHRMRKKSGDYVWLYARGESIRNQDGNPIRTAGSISDITTRKQAEAQLKRRMTQLEQMNEMYVGREGRMVDLKREVNTLLEELGRPSKYDAPKQVDGMRSKSSI